MRLHQTALSLVLIAAALPTSAAADEIYGGSYVHGVDTPFTLYTGEGGADVQFGYRLDPVTEKLGGPQPYVFGSVNTEGDTSFAGFGVSWKAEIGKVYLRPGVGLVIHDAPELRIDPVARKRTDLGSRVLFEPEIAVGVDLDDRWSVEASWVHISNAQLFDSEQNPGIDMMGLRLNYRM
ncbi:acyloxyacyl hydrolase [Qipengyuania psychrotolerans]|uniref:Acyloxyacyl hydrolase n=1 Tax=Qipengyuania psychrotolerans TaxID=2867238 RepID=A0ABX8ZE62_9SPHN|nr:acyloxyacyl hydrolase [Qipengyuania psychrotolerans]QZD87275.1 acyloxyacyl hydrolase [Qipengyuania psychrotolerans]